VNFMLDNPSEIGEQDQKDEVENSKEVEVQEPQLTKGVKWYD
jgi:hypothetical protein